MAEVNVNFMHPTDGRVISVTLDSSITGQEVVGELIANEFIPSNGEGYNLGIKGGNELNNSRTLLENGVKDNDTIRVIPATDAGICFKIN